MMSRRPNILVFQSDDHGRWASQPYGNRELHTPSMAFLAATGARMAMAFTPCPVCSPARACFWTGRIPSSHGIHDYIHELGVGREHPGLRGQRTLAMALQEAGYRTGLAGKWHCNHAEVAPPGFDFWFTSLRGTNARFAEQVFNDNGQQVTWHGHQSPQVTDAALRMLRGSRDPDQPFFLYVGYTDTHSPFSGAPERLAGHYRNCDFRDIPDETPSPVHGVVGARLPDEPQQRREVLAQYYAAVAMIDEQVGRLLDELESRGELDNTLIVYTSDHGHMNGHHGMMLKGNTTTPQNFIDESIMVPCLLRWPEGGIEPGRVHEPMVDHCDLHALLLDAAAAEQTAPDAPGRSYLPMLRGQSVDGWRTFQICEYGNARMVRSDTAKLIRRYPGPNGRFSDAFHDLRLDPRERENRLGDPTCAATIAELDLRLADFFARYEDPRHSGLKVADLPRTSNDEPWRRRVDAGQA